jgi:hypothetical protein
MKARTETREQFIARHMKDTLFDRIKSRKNRLLGLSQADLAKEPRELQLLAEILGPLHDWTEETHGIVFKILIKEQTEKKKQQLKVEERKLNIEQTKSRSQKVANNFLQGKINEDVRSMDDLLMQAALEETSKREAAFQEAKRKAAEETQKIAEGVKTFIADVKAKTKKEEEEQAAKDALAKQAAEKAREEFQKSVDARKERDEASEKEEKATQERMEKYIEKYKKSNPKKAAKKLRELSIEKVPNLKKGEIKIRELLLADPSLDYESALKEVAKYREAKHHERIALGNDLKASEEREKQQKQEALQQQLNSQPARVVKPGLVDSLALHFPSHEQNGPRHKGYNNTTYKALVEKNAGRKLKDFGDEEQTVVVAQPQDVIEVVAETPAAPNASRKKRKDAQKPQAVSVDLSMLNAVKTQAMRVRAVTINQAFNGIPETTQPQKQVEKAGTNSAAPMQQPTVKQDAPANGKTVVVATQDAKTTVVAKVAKEDPATPAAPANNLQAQLSARAANLKPAQGSNAKPKAEAPKADAASKPASGSPAKQTSEQPKKGDPAVKAMISIAVQKGQKSAEPQDMQSELQAKLAARQAKLGSKT